MKRAILPALVLGLLLVVPALSQGGDDGAAQMKKLQEQVETQGKELEELRSYVEKTKKEAAALGKSLAKAESDGFTYPAPNTSARKALLTGLQRYAKVAAGGTKAPAPAER